MSLHAKLSERAAQGRPLSVGMIGAGKFGAMYLAQVPKTPGVHVVAIADLDPAAALSNLARVGWPRERSAAPSIDAALAQGTTHVGDDWQALVRHPKIDIVVECTGNPIAAVEHCLEAFVQRKHVVNVTVEADALCGPLLARKAAEAGVVYSLAFGDQPALICDLVDWARTAGFGVVAAGRGHKWLPHFAQSTPETVWGHYGLTPEQARIGGLNAKMFNSFLDGSKPAIECTAVCNATGLSAPPDGLTYPPASIDQIPNVCRPIGEGGVLHGKGQVEVISSVERDGRAIAYDIRFGVFVVFEGDTEYLRNCFREYMVRTDRQRPLRLPLQALAPDRPRGRASRWRRSACAARPRVLRPASTPTQWPPPSGTSRPARRSTAKAATRSWGKLLPAAASLDGGALPLGLAHGVRLLRPVRQGDVLRWSDVTVDETLIACRARREMEGLFGRASPRERAA